MSAVDLHTIGRALNSATRVDHRIPPGLSLDDMVHRYHHPEWGDLAGLVAMVNGAKVEDWAHVPADGAFVVIGPRVGDPVTLALAVISVAANLYSYSKAKSQQRAARRAQERRNDRTYAWDTPNLTAYGEGAVLADVWGYHRAGGAVMGSRIEQSQIVRFGSELSLLVGLSNGPVYEMGTLTAGNYGEADFLTANRDPNPRFPYDTRRFPLSMRINGRDADPLSTVVSLRWGNTNQSQMPDWPGAYQTTLIDSELLVADRHSATYSPADADIQGVTAELFFPSGLYTTGLPTPAPNSQEVLLGWRTQGSTVWTEYTFRINATLQPNGQYVPGLPILNPFAVSVDFRLPPGSPGPFDFRIIRVGAHSADRVSAFSWKSATTRIGRGFTYPGLSYLAIRLQASEQGAGAINDVSIALKGRLVRAWVSEVDGWVEGWEAAAPWSHAIGNNPAHVFTTMLLDPRGLGRFITEDDIDLPRIRDWADLCDQNHPLDATKPLLRFDAVNDQPQDAIESLVQVCGAGRAIPVLVGGKISVKTHYRDGYSRGSGSTLNTVPARAVVAVFTTSGMRDFSMMYIDPRTHPNVYDAQILDQDADWDHRVVSVEDPESIIDDGDPNAPRLRRETVNTFGVTRRIQAVYETHLSHLANRLSQRHVEFTTVLESLPLEIGDLIAVQHDSMTPSNTTTYSARVTEAVSAGGTIKLSQAVEVTGSPPSGTGCWLREDDGTYRELQVNETAGSYPAGSEIDLWDPVAAGPAVVDIASGTQVMVGGYTTAEVVFEVTGISTQQDLSRRIEADEWSESMFDVPAGIDYGDGLPEEGGSPVPVPRELRAELLPDVTSRTMPGETRTTQIIRWSPPAATDGQAGRSSRVYVRPVGGVQWTYLGETDAQQLTGVSLPVGETYDVAVTLADASGLHSTPDQVVATSLTVPEFAGSQPSAVGPVTAAVDARSAELRWSKLTAPTIAYYEIRRGPQWYGAEPVARVDGSSYRIEAPAKATETYWVAPRTTGGLYASAPASVAVGWDMAYEIASATDLVSSAAGTVGAGLTWTGTAIEFAADNYGGTYTAAQLDADGKLELYWSAAYDLTAVEEIDYTELPTITVPSAEALWRRPEGREASVLDPGDDWEVDVSTLTGTVEDYPAMTFPRGTVGRYFRARVESRFYADAAWSAWGPHTNGFRTAESMQLRIRLDRHAVRFSVSLSNLRMWCGW